MRDNPRQYDFDFIVVGSGFGGSVSALRLTREGLPRRRDGDGPPLDAENLPQTQLVICIAGSGEPSLALRGFFSMRYFRHVTILHGCAVGGGSITYACTMLRPPDKVWDNGSWAGLADWKSEMPQHYDTASRMLGVIENRILGPSDQLAAAGGRRSRSWQHLLSHQVAIFQAPEGEPGGYNRSRSILRRRRSRAHHVHGLRRLHDGLPPRREEHARHELSVPGGEARRAGLRRDRGRRCSPARGAVDGSGGYEVRTVNSTARFRRNPRRFTCRGVVFAASSLGTMELLFRLKDKGSLPAISDQLGQLRAHQFRVADRRARAAFAGRSVEGRRDRLRRLHRRAHAHRGGALSRRFGHHGHAGHDPDRRPSRSGPRGAVAEEPMRVAAAPPDQDAARLDAVRLGARIRDPAVHAGAGRPHRHEVAAACLLAVPQVPGQPRQEGADVHSCGQ